MIDTPLLTVEWIHLLDEQRMIKRQFLQPTWNENSISIKNYIDKNILLYKIVTRLGTIGHEKDSLEYVDIANENTFSPTQVLKKNT